MAKGSEGLLFHLVGVRYRINGDGNLVTTILSFDEVNSITLTDTPLSSLTATLPLKLANFKSQGMQVEFKLTEIDETFTISRIIAYIKATATGYPQ